MLKKRKILIVSACIAAGVSLFGLWQWSGSGFRLSDAPHIRPDGKTDYAGYLNRQLESRDETARETFLYDTLGGLDTAAVGEIYAQAPAILPRFRDEVLSVLALRWGELAPQAAWTAVQSRDPYSETLARAVVRGWGARDFAAAKTTIEQMDNDARRNPLAGELFKQQAVTDPQTAAQSSIADLYQKRDPGLVSILEIWAATDREAAIAFALKNKKVSRLRGVLSNWFAENPQAVVAWLESLPAKDRGSAVGALVGSSQLIRYQPEDIRMLLQRFPSADADTQRDRMTRFLCQRFYVDPQGALSEVYASTDPELKKMMTMFVVRRQSGWDTPTAIDALRHGLPAINEDERFTFLFCSIWPLYNRDPLAALALFQEMPADMKGLDPAKEQAMTRVRPESFEDAKKLLENTTFAEPIYRAQAYGELAKSVAKGNMERLIAWQNELENPRLKKALANAIVRAYAENDPVRALEYYQSSQKKDGESSIFPDAPWGIFEPGKPIKNPTEVADWVLKNTGEISTQLMSQMMVALVQDDLPSARAVLEKIPESANKDDVRRQVMERIKELPQAQALEIAEAVGDPDFARAVRGQLLAKSAEADPESAFQMLQDPQMAGDILLAAKAQQSISDASILEPLVRLDPERAKEAIESLPEGVRDRMRVEYAECLSKSDPQRAMDALMECPPEISAPRFMGMFGHWSSMDGAAALDWAAQNVGQDAAYAKAYSSGMSYWAEYDPVAASEWLAQQPKSEVWDGMAAALVGQTYRDDPAAAFAWAQSIGEGKARREQAAKAFLMWKQRDAQAAQAALEASGLSAEEKAALAEGRKLK